MTDTSRSPLDMVEVMRSYEAWEATAARLVPDNKRRLFAHLASTSITRVIVTFDGEGDSGQIEDIQPYEGETQVDLPKGKVEILDFPYGAKQATPRKLSTHEALETLAYDLLRDKHEGWENSDGAYGEFTFDVTAGTIKLDYNERFMSSEFHQWFDEPSKLIIADFRHRALRHHAEGIFMLERFFGATITVSTGRVVPVRFVGEQHVREDLGFIPSFVDWVRCIRPEPWMGRAQPIHRDVDPFAIPTHSEMEAV